MTDWVKSWNLGSGPLLCMACMSLIMINWCLCKIIQKIGVSAGMSASGSSWHPYKAIVFLYYFELQKQNNLHIPFEYHLEVIRHTKMPLTHSFAFYPLIKLLHTQLFSFALQQILGRHLIKIFLIFTVNPSGHTIIVPFSSISSNIMRCKMEISMVY